VNRLTPHEPIHGEYNPPKEQVEEPKEENVQSLREKEKKLRERKEEVQEERGLRKKIKEHRREIKHPVYSRIRREVPERVKVARQGAVGSVRQIGHEIKQERMSRGQFPYGAPNVYARPTKAGFRASPSGTHRREDVNYGGSEPSGFARMLGEESSGYRQTPQIDLLGNSGQRKEINLMGNKGNGNKKKIRLI